MKLSTAIIALAFSTISSSLWARGPLIGTWELEYAQYKDEEGKVLSEIKDQQTRSRKILSEAHFAFITWEKNGQFSVAASGTYDFSEGIYSETIDVTSEPRLMGKTYQFNGEFKDGLWIHSGQEDGVWIAEHWRKLP